MAHSPYPVVLPLDSDEAATLLAALARQAGAGRLPLVLPPVLLRLRVAVTLAPWPPSMLPPSDLR